ncbi:hypothetical protein [Kitasatospora sp. NPDC056531]|uniref:hypothetical protein n=1 Tax=Kitasatospora sp. NPDC056531 TaxID=3345856 RepID=UPI003698B320
MTSAYQQQLVQQLRAAEDELGKLRRRVAELSEQILAVKDQPDGAYRERAHLTAWLATIYPAVITPATDIDEDGWQILYITADRHQLSWHIHPRDTDLYAHVEHVSADDPRAQWDGHTTEQKYAAIRSLSLFPRDGGWATHRRWQSTIVEARRQAARADHTEARIAVVQAALADVRATRGLLGSVVADQIDAALDGATTNTATSITPPQLRQAGEIPPQPPAAPLPQLATLYATITAQARTEAAKREVKISAALTNAGYTVVRTQPVEEIAAEPATLVRLHKHLTSTPPSRLGVHPGQIGDFTGFPAIADNTVPPGEVHLRPHPKTAP